MQLDENGYTGIEAQRVPMAPLLPIVPPDHTGQNRDLGTVRAASSLMPIEHILIARSATREVHRRMRHTFYYGHRQPCWLCSGGVGPSSFERTVESLTGNVVAASNLSHGNAHVDHRSARFYIFIVELALIDALSLG